jgi:hypothetical protein
MAKTEKELLEFWKKYIDRPIYRVVPNRTINVLLNKGINPDDSPYKNIIPKIKKICAIIQKVENKNITISFQRGNSEVTAKFVCQECLTDLSKKYIDFCASKKHIEYYLAVIPGGGVPNAIRRLTKKMLEQELPLSKKERKLIENMNYWAESLICKNKVIFVRGSSKIFENALFQLMGSSRKKKRKSFLESRYLESPFGRFEHFKKVIQKNGLIKYAYRLRNNKFYLRVRTKIPKEEIFILKNNRVPN